ncbi:GNAT family N-acetyltransferase [Devosia neptuniae]|uniref:GNAT family N-acetyltransferase n=1 Tax=Devosia neptuniae TaxID=191302 RepID=A0ABY6CAN9_9HYPH|nr:GNAT family N-acetyltransferase [Devosia neptuniae]UXN69303.1 GNAT family N-acetyltransferase [Devosia neptuniae]
MAGNSVAIQDLNDAPEFKPIVTDRIWQAFWRPYGAALTDVETALADVLAGGPFPFSLVATDGEGFTGTVTAIESDLDARPLLSPWIAALWVEPEKRGQGIAEALVNAATTRLFAQDHSPLYLCAKPPMRGFYQRLKWGLIEQDVGPDGLDVFTLHAVPRLHWATDP